MSNLDLYNKVRAIPNEAQRTIPGGRLKGMTDINPMWRIKELTEQFGVCGFGWRYEITKQWIETGGNGEIAAFVNIDLRIKINDIWSEAIPGTGGSSFVANETKGPYTSDECFKMALTDAISVACKALGFGADVYWDKDRTKYDQNGTDQKPPQQQPDSKTICEDCQKEITATSKRTVEQIILDSQKYYKKNLCAACGKKRYEEKQRAS